MITRLNTISVYVLDLQQAVSFYVEKLGFQVHTDILIDENKHWVSLCTAEQPDLQIMLIPVEEGVLGAGNPIQYIRHFIQHPIFSLGVFKCKNLAQTYTQLKEKGVQFLMAPGEGFLGQHEAAFTDDSGNWFRLTQEEGAV